MFLLRLNGLGEEGGVLESKQLHNYMTDPNKNAGHDGLCEFSRSATLPRVSSHMVIRIKYGLCHFTGSGDLEIGSLFLLDFNKVHVSFGEFNLQHFSVINCNQEYNHFSESHVSFQQIIESVSDLGDPDTESSREFKVISLGNHGKQVPLTKMGITGEMANANL